MPVPLIDPWPDEAIEGIHRTSLELLERVGVRVESTEAAGLLIAAGCRTGAEGRVLMPAGVILEAIDACPPRFVLVARDVSRSMEMDGEPGPTYVHNLGGARDMIDPATGSARRATLRDQSRLTRVMHHLANQHSICALVQPGDVPDLLEPLYSYLAQARETDKPLGGPGISHAFQAEFLGEMASALTGADGSDGRYPVDLAFSPVSPLQLGGEVTDALVATVRRGGVVVEVLPCPAAGTTSPGSLSGAVAMQNAEALAGIVLTQVIRPGTPVYYGPRLSAINPRTGAVTSGTPETGLASIAATLLARRYGLACDCYGPTSDSPVVDAQFGYEHMVNALLGLAARPRFLSGIGENQSGVGSSLEALVLDDEVLNYAFFALRPPAADADALDVDAMVEGLMGTYGFLATGHARRHLRSDFLRPTLSYRGGLEEWLASGRRGTVDLARERAEELVSSDPVGLPTSVEEDLCRLIDAAASHVGLREWPDPRRVFEE